MADAELNIVLKLLDQASGKIKETMDSAKAQTDDLKKSSEALGETTKKVNAQAEKGTKKHTDALLKARQAVQAFRKEMFVVALVVGGLSIATEEWARRNEDARESLDEISVAWKNILAQIGKVSPLMMGIKASSEVVKEFNDSMAGADIGTNLERSKNSIKNFNEDLRNQTLLFQAGKTTAEQYYQSILNSQNSVVGQNQAITQTVQQLATLQAEIGNKQMLDSRMRMEEQIALLNEWQDNHRIAIQGMASFVTLLSGTIRENLSGAITGIITGTKKASEAFKEFGLSMVEAIVNFMVQKLIAFALEKTLLAGTVAAVSRAAATIKGAWAPAAFLATVATLGAAAAQAPGSLAVGGVASLGVVQALGAASKSMASIEVSIQDALGLGLSSGPSVDKLKFHKGGMIRAHEGMSLASDERPIIAQTGEGILSRRGMRNLGGPAELDRLNNGGGGSGGNVYVTINYPRFNNREDVKELMDAFGFEIQRQLRYARGS